MTERTKSSNAANGKKIKLKGAIAQLGERLLCTQEVCGSIPHSSTNLSTMKCKVGNASKRFERVSHHPHSSTNVELGQEDKKPESRCLV